MSFREAGFRFRDFDSATDLLGGIDVLRRDVGTSLETHDLLDQGLPAKALDHLVETVALLKREDGLERALGISDRTYYRRKKDLDSRLLSREQSGRVWKFAELLAQAIRVMGTQELAEAWLSRPAIGLNGRRPVDLLSTPAGVELVEDYLGRIEYGVYT